jgi:hypothetical protein
VALQTRSTHTLVGNQPPGGFLGALAIAIAAFTLLHRRRSRRLVWARALPPGKGEDLEHGSGGGSRRDTGGSGPYEPAPGGPG